MRRIIIILLAVCGIQMMSAQPQQRRTAQNNQANARNNSNTMSVRAQISFPTAMPMSEDVVWRRDIYRELNLEDEANAGLYFPVEPIGTQMNLFTYLFKLMMAGPKRGGINAYEYRLDGNEVFDDSSKIKPLVFLDNYHIYYERNDGRIRIDNSDIPSAEVKGYYLKESAYYDQATSTFHRKVVALCPILMREDDFGEGAAKYPLFWVKYDEVAPFLSKQMMSTSSINNAATMSVDDYFTTNKYKGKIYKTTNMLGLTLAQYCHDEESMTAEQKRIEKELEDFEKNIFGDPAKKDSLDSIAAAQKEDAKLKKKSKRNRRSSGGDGEEVSTKPRKQKGSPAGTGSARVSVRRERH